MRDKLLWSLSNVCQISSVKSPSQRYTCSVTSLKESRVMLTFDKIQWPFLKGKQNAATTVLSVRLVLCRLQSSLIRGLLHHRPIFSTRYSQLPHEILTPKVVQSKLYILSIHDVLGLSLFHCPYVLFLGLCLLHMSCWLPYHASKID